MLWLGSKAAPVGMISAAGMIKFFNITDEFIFF
jgi:hypothetical protein